MKIFGGNKITGGTASRAEVYGLFIAAVVLLGGGGAVAYSASGGFDAAPTPEISETATPSASPLETQEPDTGSTNNESNTGSTNNESNTGSTNNESNTGSTTVCESAYWDSVRAERQAAVDWAQYFFNQANNDVTIIQDELTALSNGSTTEYYPFDISEWTPEQFQNMITQLTNDQLNSALYNLDLARPRLDNAIAALNSVPTC
jgi:hypothetical protein